MSTDPSNSSGPEYLEEPAADSPRSGRGPRVAVLGLAAAGVAGVVALGGWAAVSLMSDGTQPAEAIPADALGYASLDLDPSASQKIEAIKILKKFPGLEKEMDISSQDDLRRWVFEKAQEEGECKELDYDDDVAPWIGDRIAMAAVPGEKDGGPATPLLALQVTDEEAASKGISALAECGEAGEDFGFAFSGDYALISDSEEHAESLAAAAEEASLADDANFQKWTERVGDPGIVTMYAAPGAIDAMFDMQGDLTEKLSPMAGAEEQALLQAQSEMERMNERLKEMYEDFSGMAAVVRFEDGAMEAELATESSLESTGMKFTPETTIDVTSLPSGTAAVLGLGLPEDWADSYLDMLGKVTGDEQAMDQMLAQAEAQTGLEIPEDLERLLGDGVAVALDEDLNIEAASTDPMAIPAGIRVSGDPQEIRAAVDKIKRALGPQSEALVVEEGDGVVALGLDPDYVKGLAAEGDLGSDASFQDVVPDADRANSVFYLDIDEVEGWVIQAMQQGGQIGPDEKKVLDNLAPLRALGMSSWVDEEGNAGGMLLRLSTE
ncbi:MAG: DUF3352 domain-containing protein [Nocardioidaceae bacterium]